MSIEVHEILVAIRALPPRQRMELATALRREALVPREVSRAGLIGEVRGKYTHVPTSSEEFMTRKREDLAAEN